MSEKTDRAIARITQQAMSAPEREQSLAIMIEEHLTEKCTNDTVAEKLLDESKSVKDFAADIWKQAKEKAGGKGGLHWRDSEILELAEEYFGVNVPAVEPAGEIDLLSLF